MLVVPGHSLGETESNELVPGCSLGKEGPILVFEKSDVDYDSCLYKRPKELEERKQYFLDQLRSQWQQLPGHYPYLQSELQRKGREREGVLDCDAAFQ